MAPAPLFIEKLCFITFTETQQINNTGNQLKVMDSIGSSCQHQSTDSQLFGSATLEIGFSPQSQDLYTSALQKKSYVGAGSQNTLKCIAFLRLFSSLARSGLLVQLFFFAWVFAMPQSFTLNFSQEMLQRKYCIFSRSFIPSTAKSAVLRWLKGSVSDHNLGVFWIRGLKNLNVKSPQNNFKFKTLD